jgi:hypothetical protein
MTTSSARKIPALLLINMLDTYVKWNRGDTVADHKPFTDEVVYGFPSNNDIRRAPQQIKLEHSNHHRRPKRLIAAYALALMFYNLMLLLLFLTVYFMLWHSNLLNK